jgi:hypothetical protein
MQNAVCDPEEPGHGASKQFIQIFTAISHRPKSGLFLTTLDAAIQVIGQIFLLEAPNHETELVY